MSLVFLFLCATSETNNLQKQCISRFFLMFFHFYYRCNTRTYWLHFVRMLIGNKCHTYLETFLTKKPKRYA
jgi:hypothetical protein